MGEIRQFSDEAKALQRRDVANATRPKKESIGRRFGNLLRKRKVKDAMRMLKENSQMPLKSTDTVEGKTVAEIVQEKHPEGRPPNPMALSQGDAVPEFHPVVFEGSDASLIRSMVLKAKGSAGPSGLDGCGWRRLCTTFGHRSDDLCDAVAAVPDAFQGVCGSWRNQGPDCLQAYSIEQEPWSAINWSSGNFEPNHGEGNPRNHLG